MLVSHVNSYKYACIAKPLFKVFDLHGLQGQVLFRPALDNIKDASSAPKAQAAMSSPCLSLKKCPFCFSIPLAPI